MKKLVYYILTCILLLSVLPVSAQKRKYGRKKVVKVEVPVENPRFTEMLSSTQKVIIIDSVIVGKDALLTAFYTNPEEGRLATYKDFFQSQEQPNGYVYVNELGNKCFFSMTDTNGHSNLYTSDLLGGEWSKPEPLKGLDEEGLTNMNYPYLMPDGQTLYFAACNGDALGGYDIYRTRFDNENGRFRNPENIGLPFNSEDDDFLYMINEQDSIGFFATTRRMQPDKVCIYVFVPSESRAVYDIEAYDDNTIRSYARIDRIKDTWYSTKIRKEAMERWKRLHADSTPRILPGKVVTKEAFTFVVDDQTTYHRMQDFRAPGNANRMSELLSLQKQLRDLDTYLEKARSNFDKANASDRENLRNGILLAEKSQQRLMIQIKQKEKEIRNRELTTN